METEEKELNKDMRYYDEIIQIEYILGIKISKSKYKFLNHLFKKTESKNKTIEYNKIKN